MVQRVALVTGGTGYTGSHLIRRLVAAGWLVHAIVRPNSDLKLLETDIGRIKIHFHDGATSRLVEIVSIAKPDVVFHLAALVLTQHTPKDVVPLLQSNLVFSTQLAEAMAENGIGNMINTGTFWQHYENKEYAPTCLYAATKQAFEAILQYYVDAKSFKVITLKLFDSYGPQDPRPKLFSMLREAGESGQTLLMSPGGQLIDLVHIDDVVEAFIIASCRLLNENVDGHQRYAVSSGNPVNLRVVVSTYERVANVKLSIQWGGRPYRDREVMLPWNRGDSLPGWEPKITLDDGLRTIIPE
jgi:nucleoside-diphosphate-sugar epimerase